MPFILDDMLLMAALGAGGGALFNKKDPLTGALMGGALGGLGGAIAPGLLGAGGVAPTAAAEGGLLAGGEQAAMLAAQNAGLEGATAATNAALAPNAGLLGIEQAAAPVVNMSQPAGMIDKLNYQSNGLLGQGMETAEKVGKVAAPVGAAMNVANAMAGNEPQIQAPPPPQLNRQPMNLNETIGLGNQMRQFDAQDAERRKQLMQMYASRIGGY